MKIISPIYASKLYLAVYLAQRGCRAVTITAVARTKPADSRTLYTRVHKYQSESGQTPTSHNWFLQNQQRRVHAAVLLIFYAKYRLRYEGVHDSHGIAFALTLNKYQEMCATRETIVSPERVNLLITGGFSVGWKGILQGSPSKFSSENVKIIPCRKCKMPLLVEAHYLNYVCDCQNTSH